MSNDNILRKIRAGARLRTAIWLYQSGYLTCDYLPVVKVEGVFDEPTIMAIVRYLNSPAAKVSFDAPLSARAARQWQYMPDYMQHKWASDSTPIRLLYHPGQSKWPEEDIVFIGEAEDYLGCCLNNLET